MDRRAFFRCLPAAPVVVVAAASASAQPKVESPPLFVLDEIKGFERRDEESINKRLRAIAEAINRTYPRARA